MAQGKQTPRQKMINLMYLVFIAMLAMNIDQEIIRSYYESTQSLTETRLLTQRKNEQIFEKTLESKAQTVPDTYAEPWSQYMQLKEKIDVLVKHADQVKDKLKLDAGFREKDEAGKPVDLRDNFSSLNNTESSTAYFFNDGDENKPSAKAGELKQKIDDVRNYINSTFGNNPQLKDIVERANKSLITEFPKNNKDISNKNWLQTKFYNQPLIAAISNLGILQNDARNVQSDALALMLQEKVDATIKFNQYSAVVSAPTDVVQGKPAEATVYLASYSNSNKINITGVNRQENGKGYIALGTNGLGEKTISGKILLNSSTGVQEFPYSHKYNVIAGPQEVKFETGAVVAADKMNVMYRNLENPISGSILGVDNSRLSLTASGATVRPAGAGKWIVVPGATSVVKLTISGSGPRGATSKSFDFRVKPVPPPQGQIRGRNVVNLPASSIPNQILTAAIPDFDFPVTFNVTSFLLKVPGRAAIPISGSNLNGAAGAVRGLRAGDVVYIYGIKYTAQGVPVAAGREASPVVINIQ